MRWISFRWLAAGPIVVAAGCAAPTPPVPVTPADLPSLTYREVLAAPVTLSAGTFEGAPYDPGGAARPRVVLLEELTRLGDLNGDGVTDAAALLVSSTGGSGEFVHLAAVTGAGGEPENVDTVLLGDRVDLRSVHIDGGKVHLRLLMAGPDDAACCPMEDVSLAFGLTDGKLVEVAEKHHGRLSAGSLAGTTWQLSHMDQDEPVTPAETVTLRFLPDGEMTGSAGCNRYSGPYELDTEGWLRVGPLRTTFRLCRDIVMGLEQRYLRALEAASHVGFYNARLALSYHVHEDAGVLLFESAEEGGE
ncbi:MAG: META domain-containing protein [Gammaproteobacteria bacterium]